MLRAVSTPLPVAGEKIDDCGKVKGLLFVQFLLNPANIYPYPNYTLF